MAAPQIELKNLEITYNIGKENEFKATRGVSMEIYPGEFVAFFGPSGCGKSTIFYSILGILAPSAGELYVKGRNPYSFSPEEMVRFQTKTIGIIYQAFYLINSLSVIDNVSLTQIFHNVSPHERKKRARALLARFGLTEKAENYPDNLSGGQMQRVSVTRSIMNNPDILLADEPTGNLDSISTKQVMDALEEINQKDKKTVVMITHNAAQLQYCHRVFYMKDGKLLRTVPNPEKKQIAKVDKQSMLITEMEYLQKIYPHLAPVEIKVKSIVNYLTQDLNVYQLERLEELTKVMIQRRMDKHKYYNYLKDKFRDGGIGLNASLAKLITEKIIEILKQSEDVTRYRRRLKNNTFFNKEASMIRKLTKYVLKSEDVKVDNDQFKLIRELVHRRINGLIKKEEFLNNLKTAVSKGGAGFSEKTASLITNYFEKLLIQGVEIEAPGH